MSKVNAGQIVNKWIGTGTITSMEFVNELNKFRFLLESPVVTKDADGDDALHTNYFSINFPTNMSSRIRDAKYADGDFVYVEGMLSQSDRSRSVKISAVYIRHFNAVPLNIPMEDSK